MGFRERFKNDFNGAFATNSVSEVNSLIWKSLPLWVDYTDDNLLFIPGRINNNQPFYGLNAFVYMIDAAIKRGYDYIIYFDEDAFLVPGSEKQLEELFNDFVKSDCVIAGCPDGGSFCHRTHNNLLINTFFSFWNIKALKTRGNPVTVFLESINNNPSFAKFKSSVDPQLLLSMNIASKEALKFSKEKNKELSSVYPKKEFPYCDIVRNDPNNFSEPHQVPYSCREDDFEPYYILLEFLIKYTNKGIYYFKCSDYNDGSPVDVNNINEMDGITSAVYDVTGKKLIMLHTWFSRDYTRPLGSRHRDRIRNVCEYVKSLNNSEV